MTNLQKFYSTKDIDPISFMYPAPMSETERRAFEDMNQATGWKLEDGNKPD